MFQNCSTFLGRRITYSISIPVGLYIFGYLQPITIYYSEIFFLHKFENIEIFWKTNRPSSPDSQDFLKNTF